MLLRFIPAVVSIVYAFYCWVVFRLKDVPSNWWQDWAQLVFREPRESHATLCGCRGYNGYGLLNEHPPNPRHSTSPKVGNMGSCGECTHLPPSEKSRWWYSHLRSGSWSGHPFVTGLWQPEISLKISRSPCLWSLRDHSRDSPSLHTYNVLWRGTRGGRDRMIYLKCWISIMYYVVVCV